MKFKYYPAFILAAFIVTGCGMEGLPLAEDTDGGSRASTLQAADIASSGSQASAEISNGSFPLDSQASTEISNGSFPLGSQASGAGASESTDLGGGSPGPSASAGNTSGSGSAESFAALHGALSVKGTSLTDQNGSSVRLYGMSTHGIAWFPQYVSYDAFRTLRDDWNTNCVRLALYTDEYNGYSNGGNQEELKSLVKEGIDYATDLGMYVIVDWHVLNDRDPNVHKEDAVGFFREISSLYGDHTNILYEICNEPNGSTTWDNIKSYANEVIPVIRENDADAVILVGTPTWSQDIHQAAASPLEFDNVMYTLHFYAATHTDDLRSRLETCVSEGLPVFISEFGMCDASGNGGNDFGQAEKWMELMDKYQISFCCWNLANKAETSSVLKSGCDKTSDWAEDDLSESGRWIRERFRGQTE